MSASIAGAVKTAVEAAGLSLTASRDEAPKNPPANYVVIHEGISIVPEPAFPAVDDTTGHVSELVQVDLVQRWRNPASNVLLESFTVTDGLIRALHGARFASAPKRVFVGTVVGTVRRLMRSDNKVVVHITLKLRRVM